MPRVAGKAKTTSVAAVCDIVDSVAHGELKQDIAKRYEVTPGQIGHVCTTNKELIAKIRNKVNDRIIEQNAEKAAAVIKKEIHVDDTATDRIVKDLDEGKNADYSDLAVKKQFGTAKLEVLKIAGIIQPNVNNQYNQYNQTNNTKIDSAVLTWLTEKELFEPVPMNDIVEEE